jgi:isoleucyl-tRNA synthetase
MEMPESVHLSDWPSVKEPDSASQKLLEEMYKARQFIAEGLAQRAEHKIKVRQPLASITIPELPDDFKEIVQEELNVKEVKFGQELSLDTAVTPELKREGISRDLIRAIQSARKKADFKVEDRIQLGFETDSEEVRQAFEEHKDKIYAETLTTGELEGEAEHREEAKIEGQTVELRLKRQALQG